MAVLDNNNNVLEAYVHGPDLSGSVGGGAGGIGGILSVVADGQQYFYHYDGNGNVGLLTDGDGTVATRLEYSPFGEVLICSGTYTPRYQFSSKELDPSTGMNYYGYRFYNSQLGRWINRDPIFEEGGINLYCAILNNPVIHLDYLGLHCDDCVAEQTRCAERAASARSKCRARVIETAGEMLNTVLDQALKKIDWSQEQIDKGRDNMLAGCKKINNGILRAACRSAALADWVVASSANATAHSLAAAALEAEVLAWKLGELISCDLVYEIDMHYCDKDYLACLVDYGLDENGCPCPQGE